MWTFCSSILIDNTMQLAQILVQTDFLFELKNQASIFIIIF